MIMSTAEIYILFSCNEWKNRDSMKLVAATSNPLKFKEILTDEIRQRNMEVYNDDVLSLPIVEINAQLDYGHIEIVRDGEVQ